MFNTPSCAALWTEPMYRLLPARGSYLAVSAIPRDRRAVHVNLSKFAGDMSPANCERFGTGRLIGLLKSDWGQHAGEAPGESVTDLPPLSIV
jgi:hypothetical protein